MIRKLLFAMAGVAVLAIGLASLSQASTTLVGSASATGTPTNPPTTWHTFLWAKTASGGPLPACSEVPDTYYHECVPDPTQPLCTITHTGTFTTTPPRPWA